MSEMRRDVPDFEIVDGMRVPKDFRTEARLNRVAKLIRDTYQRAHEGEPMIPTDVDFAIARAIIALPCGCWSCSRANAIAE